MDNNLVITKTYTPELKDKIDPQWILSKLLEIFEDNASEGEKFIGEIYENSVIIINNDDECCNISVKIEDETKLIINIDLIMKCSNRKGSGSQTVKNIIQFGVMYGYDYIDLVDKSRLYFDLGKKESTSINLLHLKLLTTGTSWYGSFGFHNSYSIQMEPIFKEFIEMSFEELIQTFNGYVDTFEIGKITKQTTKSEFEKNIDGYLNLMNIFCNADFNINTPIKVCFLNLEKCIYVLYNSYDKHNKETSKIGKIKDKIIKVKSFIEFILSNICKIKMNFPLNIDEETILKGLGKVYMNLELDLNLIQLTGGKQKTKQNKTKLNKTKQKKTKQKLKTKKRIKTN